MRYEQRKAEMGNTEVTPGVCSECESAESVDFCLECADRFCGDCFQKMHAKGARARRQKIAVAGTDSQTLARSRDEYNRAFRELDAVRLAGHPEVVLPSMDYDLPDVPIITAADF